MPNCYFLRTIVNYYSKPLQIIYKLFIYRTIVNTHKIIIYLSSNYSHSNIRTLLSEQHKKAISFAWKWLFYWLMLSHFSITAWMIKINGNFICNHSQLLCLFQYSIVSNLIAIFLLMRIMFYFDTKNNRKNLLQW